MTIIGIDPGKSGGIAWIQDGKPCVEKMPETKEESKPWLLHQMLVVHFSKALSHKKEASRAQEDERCRLRKAKGFLDRCYENRSQYDERLLHETGFFQSFFPSLTCARKPCPFLHLGELASKPSVPFFRSTLLSLSHSSTRDDFSPTLIRSSTFYYMLIFLLLAKFGKSAKALDFHIRNTRRISNKTSDPWVFLWLFFSRRSGHHP